VLPDIEIALPTFGPGRVLIARDVPAAVFFYGFPTHARLESTRSFAAVVAMETWLDGLLARVIVAPRLSRALAARLGTDRDLVAHVYLTAVGWLEAPKEGRSADELPSAAPRSIEEAPVDPTSLRALATPPPGPQLAATVRRVASATKTPPHVVWTRWTISEFIFTWRVLAHTSTASKGDIYTNHPTLLAAEAS
jgi:hypothetical protein